MVLPVGRDHRDRILAVELLLLRGSGLRHYLACVELPLGALLHLARPQEGDLSLHGVGHHDRSLDDLCYTGVPADDRDVPVVASMFP